jgi:hypothetical protein
VAVNDEGRPERRPLTDADQRRTTLARERIQTLDRHRRIATMADELMPMAVWYRQPKGCFYCIVVEGWAA